MTILSIGLFLVVVLLSLIFGKLWCSLFFGVMLAIYGAYLVR